MLGDGGGMQINTARGGHLTPRTQKPKEESGRKLGKGSEAQESQRRVRRVDKTDHRLVSKFKVPGNLGQGCSDQPR